MKKSILSIALAALAVLTVSTSAMAAKPERCQSDSTECCAPGGKKKCHKQRKDRRCDSRRDSAQYNPFANLNLTATQQEAIAAIPTPREVMKAAREQQADTTVSPRVMMHNVRQNYLTQVKNILTPEQYTQFLENNYIDNPMMGKKMKSHKGNHPKQKKADAQRRGHHARR